MASLFRDKRATEGTSLNSGARATLRGNAQTEDVGGPKSPTAVKAAPIFTIVLAATMIGATSGVMIADPNALLLLKENIASQIAGLRGYQPPGGDDVASAKPDTLKVIRTGLGSIAAIYYSSTPDSASMAFDLEAAHLVRMERLRSPDRIYLDLRHNSSEQGKTRRLKAQDAVSISGNLLTGVRISQRAPGFTRIVLDLKRSCDFTYQTLPGPPSRLTVEIRPRHTGVNAQLTSF